jgi:hypothetical protein
VNHHFGEEFFNKRKMNNVTLITPPDDVYFDGLRVLLVDVTRDQSQIITEALTMANHTMDILVYVWNINDTVEWLFDRKNKSNLVIFNAESANREIVGYMAAQHNSYYMGTLMSLGIINNKAIKDTDTCAVILENYIINHAKR